MDRFDDKAAKELQNLNFRILNWIGIINQLAGALAQTSLATINLAMPEFLMLNHFSHQPHDGKTIKDVCRARQQNQPGASKVIKKLLNKKLLRSETNPADARSNLLYITPHGLDAHGQAATQLEPILVRAFAGLDDSSKQQLFDQLDTLKRWFDDNREYDQQK